MAISKSLRFYFLLVRIILRFRLFVGQNKYIYIYKYLIVVYLINSLYTSSKMPHASVSVFPPGGQDVAEEFRSQEIDGQALLLLTEDHLVSTMNLKLGPALKLCAHINSLKDA